MRDKRLTHVDNTYTEHLSNFGRCSVFILPDVMLCSEEAAPTLHFKQKFIMKLIITIVNVCERLFEELIKELLNEHYIVVSAHSREIDGKKVRFRKAHLRKRKS